jgi:hypothetical protein
LKGTHTTLDTAPLAHRAFSTPDTAPEPTELKPRAAAPPRGAVGEWGEGEAELGRVGTMHANTTGSRYCNCRLT